MALEPRTVALMAEYFADKVCCKCGGKATRVYKNRFFCLDDYPHPVHPPVEIRRSKDADPAKAGIVARRLF